MNNSWIEEEIKMENITKMFSYAEKSTYQNLGARAKVKMWGKYKALNLYIRRKESLRINNCPC